MHKEKQAPYALVSLRNNPLAFRAMDRLLSLLGRQASAFLFPRIHEGERWYNHVDPESAMSGHRAVSWLRMKIRETKLPLEAKAFSKHSARRGGLNDALRRKVPVRFTEVQGHWSPGGGTVLADYDVQAVDSRLAFF